MQLILTVGLALTLGFSLLQCENNAAATRSETAQTNQTTAQTNAPATAATPEEAPRISLADAKKDFDAKTAIFVDTRAEVSYKTEHIKGAINIPAEAFQTRYTEVPKDKKIIAYCSWPSEHTSARAVQILKEKGYNNAYALLGGTAGWKEAGYPMEQAEAQK